MKNVLVRVKHYLTIDETLRDNDNRLLANIWNEVIQRKYIDVNLASAQDLLRMLAEGSLPNQESVRRCRQKLQEENPELRGRLWEKRHQMAKQVKEEIKNWNDPDKQGGLFG